MAGLPANFSMTPTDDGLTIQLPYWTWTDTKTSPWITASGVSAAGTPTTGSRFIARLVPEGVMSSDNRIFEPGSIFSRKPPIPLMGKDRTKSGHDDAVFVGNILNVWRADGWIWGEGRFDTSAEAAKYERLVREGRLSRVSVDSVALPENVRYVNCDIDPETGERQAGCHQVTSRAELLGATIEPFAAFGDTDIRIIERDEEMVVASAGLFRDDAFARPEPDVLTPVTWDGNEVYGHLAAWGACHIGIQNRCAIAPRSENGYAHYMVGKWGNERIGVITYDTVHYGAGDRYATERHYADTGSVAAYVKIIDGELGPWFSGVIEPTLDEDVLRRLSACGVSGDWREDPSTGNLELVAILAVPTPGFTIPRFEDGTALVASLTADGECIGCNESEKAAEEVEALVEAGEPEPVEPVVEETQPVEPVVEKAQPVVEETDTELAENFDALLDEILATEADARLSLLLAGSHD